jgi:predicted MFS family arabinose efflux permease
VAAGFADFGGWRSAMVAVGAVSVLAAAAAWLSLRDDQASAEADGQGAASGGPAALQILGSRCWVGTAMLWLLFVVMLTISYCLNSWLPIMLVEVGHDEAFAALSITIFGFGGAIAALGVGLLIDRFGPMPVLICFLAAAATALFATGQVIATASRETLAILLGAAGFFSLGAYGG